MSEYVCGFLFSYKGSEVALIRKNKPAWQKGKLNGIGGKIEPGETPLVAMVREFKEETGALVTNWKPFCSLLVAEGGAVIHFFACQGWVELATTTDEAIEWWWLDEALESSSLIANLKWLLPLAWESLSNPKTAFVHSERP